MNHHCRSGFLVRHSHLPFISSANASGDGGTPQCKAGGDFESRDKPAPTVSRTAGFTLVEILIGSTLAATIMLAMLSSYLFIGRNLVRLANMQTLEAQSRRTLAYLAQDIRMASAITSPSDTSVTFTLPTNAGTTTVTYAFDNNAHTLTRTPASGTAQVLLFNITTSGFDLNYYDTSSNAVTDFTNRLNSIKQVSMTFSCQTGESTNGTQTPIHKSASSRLIIRNKALLD